VETLKTEVGQEEQATATTKQKTNLLMRVAVGLAVVVND